LNVILDKVSCTRLPRKPMSSGDWTKILARKLPLILSWIDATVAEHHSLATPVADLDLPHLSRYFPSKLLRQTTAVHLTEQLPLPPLNEIGLDEFSPSKEQHTYEATTYGETIFLQEGHVSEVLYFHELVHVIQWKRLGKEPFLVTYIAGLLEHGYEDNPLEEIAFSLQEKFRQGDLPGDLTEIIHKHTDSIWQNTAQSYHLV